MLRLAFAARMRRDSNLPTHVERLALGQFMVVALGTSAISSRFGQETAVI